MKETAPRLISDAGVKTVSVLVHKFLRQYRANSEFTLYISALNSNPFTRGLLK